MKAPEDCQQPAYHKMHLCILQHLNEEEVKRLTANPEYRCQRCKLQADQEKNLCQPKHI